MKESTTSKAMRQSMPPAPETSASDDTVDLREQLCNGRAVGPTERVSFPEAMITSLHGILLDVDPKTFRKDAGAAVRNNPKQFYQKVIRPMLVRHPVLERAAVRISGTGLHVLVMFDEPVEFKTEAERQRWGGIVKVVQRLLPTDFNAPGITALTRPVGSINGKNTKTVISLTGGQPISPAAVVKVFEEVQARPFATVANILFGNSPITPCPVCGKDGSSLGVMDRCGKCYAGGCGTVKLARLYDHFLLPGLHTTEGK